MRKLQRILVRRQGNRTANAAAGLSAPKAATPKRNRQWVKNQERNQIIRNLLSRDEDRRRVCLALDERTIEVLPILKQNGVHSWAEGWEDPELRSNIQQLFSKLLRSAEPVKS